MPQNDPIIPRDPFGGYADWMIPLMLGTQTLQNVGAAIRPSEIRPANPLEGFLGISLIGQREESVRQRDAAIENQEWLRLTQGGEFAAKHGNVEGADVIDERLFKKHGAPKVYGAQARQMLTLGQQYFPGTFSSPSQTVPSQQSTQYLPTVPGPVPDAQSMLSSSQQQSPTQAQGLAPGRSITYGPGGMSTTVQQEPRGSKQVTANFIAQAEEQGLRPSQVRARMGMLTQQTSNGPITFVPDEEALKAYEERVFGRNVKGLTAMFIQDGKSYEEAFRQAARVSLQELGYIPANWHGIVNPSDTEVTNAASQRALATTRTMMRAFIEGAKSTGGRVGQIPQNLLGEVIDSDPHLSPQQRSLMKEQMAEGFAESLIPLFQQGGVPRELAEQQARQKASAAVGGVVPSAWHQQGLSSILTPEQFQLYTANPEAYNPYTSEGVRKLQGAGVELSEAKKLTEPAIAAEAQKRILLGPQPQAGALPKAPGPAPLAKATEEQFQVGKRRGAEKLATEEEVRLAHRIAPEADLKNVQGLDAIYTNATRLLQLQPQIEAKYGNIPGGFIGLMNTMQRGVGARDPLLRQYVNLVQETFNLKKKEFAGTAVSARERTDLSDYIPDESTNVREVFGLMKNLRTSSGIMLERDLGVLKDNYPRTNINSLFFVREREASKRRGAPK